MVSTIICKQDLVDMASISLLAHPPVFKVNYSKEH